MTMIEKVARAVASCQEEIGEDEWRYCIPEAKAAINAMRDPVVNMLWATNGFEVDGPYLCESEAAAIWDTMIEKALMEESS